MLSKLKAVRLEAVRFRRDAVIGPSRLDLGPEGLV